MPLAGCLGKLPLHGDFIRCNADSAAALELDAWISEGLYAAKQAFGARFDEALDALEPVRFLYRAPQCGEIVAGLVRGSRDRVGRRYPFMVFTALGTAAAAADACRIPLDLEVFFASAASLATEGWRDGELSGFKTQVEALRSCCDPENGSARLDSYLSATPRSEMLGGLAVAGNEAERYTLLANLTAMLGSEAGARYVLRFPGAGGAEDAVTWLLLARSLGAGGGIPPAVFWGGGGAASGMRALWGAAEPRFLPDLMWPDSDTFHRKGRSPCAANLALDGLDSPAYWKAMSDRLEPWFRGGAHTLGEWLRELPGLVRP